LGQNNNRGFLYLAGVSVETDEMYHYHSNLQIDYANEYHAYYLKGTG